MKNENKSSANASRRFIHMAVRRLGMDDWTYREFLASLTGKKSTRDMTGAELGRVCAELGKNPAVTRNPSPAAIARREPGSGPPIRRGVEGMSLSRLAADVRAAKIRLIWFLCYELQRNNALDRVDAGVIDAFTRRFCAVDSLAACDMKQVNKVAVALSAWLRKAVKNSAPKAANETEGGAS